MCCCCGGGAACCCCGGGPCCLCCCGGGEACCGCGISCLCCGGGAACCGGISCLIGGGVGSSMLGRRHFLPPLRRLNLLRRWRCYALWRYFLSLLGWRSDPLRRHFLPLLGWLNLLRRWRRTPLWLLYLPHRRRSRRGVLWRQYLRGNRRSILRRLYLLRWLLWLVWRPLYRHFIAAGRRRYLLRLVWRLWTRLDLILTTRSSVRWGRRSRDRSWVNLLRRRRSSRSTWIQSWCGRTGRLVRCLWTRLDLLLPLRGGARRRCRYRNGSGVNRLSGFWWPI